MIQPLTEVSSTKIHGKDDRTAEEPEKSDQTFLVPEQRILRILNSNVLNCAKCAQLLTNTITVSPCLHRICFSCVGRSSGEEDDDAIRNIHCKYCHNLSDWSCRGTGEEPKLVIDQNYNKILNLLSKCGYLLYQGYDLPAAFAASRKRTVTGMNDKPDSGTACFRDRRSVPNETEEGEIIEGGEEFGEKAETKGLGKGENEEITNKHERELVKISTAGAGKSPSLGKKRKREEEDLTIHAGNVYNGTDLRTTTKVSNIPRIYTEETLLEEIDHYYWFQDQAFRILKFSSDYGTTTTNQGNLKPMNYCLFDFYDPWNIVSFHRQFHGERWDYSHQEQRCQVTYAIHQEKRDTQSQLNALEEVLVRDSRAIMLREMNRHELQRIKQSCKQKDLYPLIKSLHGAYAHYSTEESDHESLRGCVQYAIDIFEALPLHKDIVTIFSQEDPGATQLPSSSLPSVLVAPSTALELFEFHKQQLLREQQEEKERLNKKKVLLKFQRSLLEEIFNARIPRDAICEMQFDYMKDHYCSFSRADVVLGLTMTRIVRILAIFGLWSEVLLRNPFPLLISADRFHVYLRAKLFAQELKVKQIRKASQLCLHNVHLDVLTEKVNELLHDLFDEEYQASLYEFALK